MASYLHNISWAVVFGILVLCALALAPPLFTWDELFTHTFFGMMVVDLFIAGLILATLFILFWQHFNGNPNTTGAS